MGLATRSSSGSSPSSHTSLQRTYYNRRAPRSSLDRAKLRDSVSRSHASRASVDAGSGTRSDDSAVQRRERENVMPRTDGDGQGAQRCQRHTQAARGARFIGQLLVSLWYAINGRARGAGAPHGSGLCKTSVPSGCARPGGGFSRVPAGMHGQEPGCAVHGAGGGVRWRFGKKLVLPELWVVYVA